MSSKIPQSAHPEHKNPPWYISGIAGSLGMTAELTLGGQVLNRVLIAQQANPDLTVINAVKSIYNQNGIKSFFVGYRWNVGMAVCKGFTRWSLNNTIFSFCQDHIPKEVQKNHQYLVPTIVGIGGAIFETTVYLCPLESLKTREMTILNPHGDKNKIWRIIRDEKGSIFFKGWTGLFPRQAITWVTYLLVYDKYRTLLIKARGENQIGKVEKIAMNFMTGATAAFLTTPFDLYKTQRQKENPIEQKNIVSSIRFLFFHHGLQGVYRSLPIRLVRSGFYAASTFTVMDFFDALPARMKL